MPAQETLEQRILETARSARTACIAFGIGLLGWGLAPAIIARVATGHAPPLQIFATSALALLLGLAFTAFGILVGRGVVWALWTVLTLSLLLIVGNIIFAVVQRNALFSAFALLLPAAAAGTSWIALETRRAVKRVKHAAQTT